MFGKFSIMQQLWRSARLTLRLLRDSRVPMLAKVVFYATALYMLSPFDFVPDWIPVLGQADDLVAIMAGLNLFFFRICPSWLVEEHEAVLDGRLPEGDETERPSRVTDPIDGTYRRMA